MSEVVNQSWADYLLYHYFNHTGGEVLCTKDSLSATSAGLNGIY